MLAPFFLWKAAAGQAVFDFPSDARQSPGGVCVAGTRSVRRTDKLNEETDQQAVLHHGWR
jgi:hypothetical protein